MPTLDWIGKKAVENHHKEVPYRLLRGVPELSAGEPGTGNLLVQGDNLEALKALLPYYAGKVKCIYIDPPYNTGNENWIYNDAVNSPEMRQWLGTVVGRDDLSSHDKWLCMMYPRLALLREFLTEEGAIFISIDDNEVQNLRAIMDELFGKENFVATIIWQKVYSPKNSARHLSEDHDYIVVYAKNADLWKPNLISRSASQDDRYKNPDNDPRGPWKTSDLSARNPYSLGTYSVRCPSGRVIEGPPKGRYWVVSQEKFEALNADNRIWWGKDGTAIPQVKKFLSEVKQGVVPQTLWKYEDVGHTQEAKQELVGMCDFADSASVFITPKPVRLIQKILEIASDSDSIVMDSFAGSGTTAHAVLKANASDNGKRRFIMIEMEEYADRITSARVQRAIEGYGEGTDAAPALGGGFDYYTVGEPMFLPDENLNEAVGAEAIRAYVAYSEGIPTDDQTTAENPHSPYLLGLNRETAWIFHYEPDTATSLDMDFLAGLRFGGSTRAGKPGTVIIYADRCLLSVAFMAKHGIIFKKIPRDITRF